jgi:hypothetical protein
MGALVDYAAYFTEDPAYPDDVIFNIPVRVKKIMVEGGAIEAFAAFYGWQPTDEVNAPDTCIEQIKRHMREVSFNAFAAAKNANLQAELVGVKTLIES